MRKRKPKKRPRNEKENLGIVILGQNYQPPNQPAGNLVAPVTSSPTQTQINTATDTSIIATTTKTQLPPNATPDPRYHIGSTMISDKDGMVMVYVPAGEFELGSENGKDD